MAVDADFLVTEMGMNNVGEIALLSEMVRPDIAIITRISNAHAGFLTACQRSLKQSLKYFWAWMRLAPLFCRAMMNFMASLPALRACPASEISSALVHHRTAPCALKIWQLYRKADITASCPVQTAGARKTTNLYWYAWQTLCDERALCAGSSLYKSWILTRFCQNLPICRKVKGVAGFICSLIKGAIFA